MFWFWWFGDVLKWFGNAESQCVKLCLAQEKAGIECQLKFSPTRFQKCARLELCKRHLAQTVWSGEVRLPAAQLKWDVIRVSRNISRFNHNNTTTQHQDWKEKTNFINCLCCWKLNFCLLLIIRMIIRHELTAISESLVPAIERSLILALPTMMYESSTIIILLQIKDDNDDYVRCEKITIWGNAKCELWFDYLWT